MTVAPGEEECKHGINPQWCSLCLHPGVSAVRDHIEATFEARYTGNCPDCHEPIEKGDVVHKLMPSGHVIHEFCP